jgi:hypothetical protein
MTAEGGSGHVKAITPHVTGGTVVTRPAKRDDQANRVVDVDNWLACKTRTELTLTWHRTLNKMLEHPDLSFLQALEAVWANERGEAA